MKATTKAFILFILLVTPLLLLGTVNPIFNNEAKVLQIDNPKKVSIPSYETHGPIWILNDTAFDQMATNEDWAGDGSPGSPYIIEGYNITSDVIGIMIQHVTVCFEIRGCYIADLTAWTSFGIGIIDAPQASIVDTVIESKHLGMELEDIDSLSVTGCTLTDIEDEGIYVIHCDGSIIDDCTVYNSYGTGIGLHEANNTVITNCNMTFLDYGSGVYLYNSHFVTISHNNISECANSGIWSVSSPHLTVEDNIIHNNFFYIGPMCGIHLYGSPYASIVGNEIYDNTRNGIYVELSDWVYIFDNEIYGSADHGIDVMYSHNGTILQNDIYDNGWEPVIVNAICGIYLGFAMDWVISDNSLWNNTPAGISIEDSERVQISNNHIFNNTDVGIYATYNMGSIVIIASAPSVFGSSEIPVSAPSVVYNNLIISENQIHYNGDYGIYLEGYSNCSIVDNQISGHVDHGIEFWGDWNEVIGNEIYNCETGIGSYECYNNTFSDNVIYLCLGGLDIMNIGSNVTGNIIYDNEYGIIMDASGNCSIYGNDIGWNTMNAWEQDTFSDGPLKWYNDVTHIGNHWHNYNYTGYYNITTDTGIDNQDLYPSRSLDLTRPSPIEFEILELGNIMVWEAYALNPSHYELFIDGESEGVESWDGDDIELIVEQLSHGAHTIELVVYHISGHSMGNTSSASVEDLTPPTISGAVSITLVDGENVSNQYTATDPSGIDEWIVNDTAHFAISSTGLLTNTAPLAIGEYAIIISVSDIYGNTASITVVIEVEAPPGELPVGMILAVGGGGAIILLIVLTVLYKRKGT